ncbi:MAG: DHA2 family efflux MFS transporter permease subunit, partial [Peptococcaceae bacterium]|nr:DHA2 family efflux MFS transporter permease subunit [Peptococcaceae bacterium]
TGRVIQAVGSGILLPLMTNVFLSIFPPESRGKAMGIMGIAMIFAPALGPTVGGWVVETYTWRLLFYAMVPIGIFDLILASIWMKNVLDRSFPKFDLSGAVLSTIGFGGLLYGVSEAGNKGWGNDIVLSALGIGVVALIIFVRRELRITVPLLELRVFKYDMFTLTMVISAIVNMSMYAGMLLLPIYLQNIRNFTALQSGFLLLPGALIMGFMGPIAGAVFDRIGARLLSIIGLVVMTLTTWEFSKLTLGTMYSHIITLYIFRSFGMSLLLMPLMAAGLNQLPRVLNSHGTAMRNTVRQVAGSLGTAVLVTVMSTRTTIHLANYSNVVSAANPVITTQLSSLAQNLGFPPQAGPAVAVQTVYGIVAKQAAVDGINDAFIVATGITVVALLLAFFIRRVFPPEAESTD